MMNLSSYIQIMKKMNVATQKKPSYATNFVWKNDENSRNDFSGPIMSISKKVEYYRKVI